jgi:hypothetical protein
MGYYLALMQSWLVFLVNLLGIAQLTIRLPRAIHFSGEFTNASITIHTVIFARALVYGGMA